MSKAILVGLALMICLGASLEFAHRWREVHAAKVVYVKPKYECAQELEIYKALVEELTNRSE